MSAGEVLVVSGEPLWPSTHGGRIRTAHLASEIGRRLPVRVVAPLEDAAERDVPVVELPPARRPRRLVPTLTPRPRLGQFLLDHPRQTVVRQVIAVHRPRAVLFAQSYLAAMLPDLGTPMVVDFSDVEVRRMTSLAGEGTFRARVAFAVEGGKARWWEPAVARRAMLCTTPSEADAGLLRTWGATPVLVPHGADPALDSCPSPADGPVTYVASFSYRPNREGADFVLREVWPRLRRREPEIRLRLVGRHADLYLRGEAERAGVEVVSDPVATDRYYREASVVLAPVRVGGGAQVKVTEALAQGRVVVATPFSAASAPPGARQGVGIAEGAEPFASAVCHLWRDVDERHRRETLLGKQAVPGWEEACAPLVEALAGVVSPA
ncbi:MAG: glycosyltransferase family 4 protein [Actinomycetota bacterium]|nr:glycosyltransferase family 4 protein [Actinomycetota bacterium]